MRGSQVAKVLKAEELLGKVPASLYIQLGLLQYCRPWGSATHSFDFFNTDVHDLPLITVLLWRPSSLLETSGSPFCLYDVFPIR